MTELQVQYFLETAKCSNMTRVAERFYVSQPAVSLQISALEQELGCKLFRRVKSKLVLTEAGKLFVNFFEATSNKLIECKVLAQEMDSKNREIIRVGILEGWNTRILLSDIGSVFRLESSEKQFFLESRGFKDLIRSLVSNRLDMILDLGKADLDGRIFDSQIVTNLSRVLLYPSQLAEKGYRGLADFRDETFIVISDDEVASSVRAVEACCQPHGFLPKIHIVPNISSMIMGVQWGLGVAIVDDWTDAGGENLSQLPLDAEPHRVRLAWRRNCPDYVKNFIDRFPKIPG